MKIAVYNSKNYDREYITQANSSRGDKHELTFFDVHLNETTVNLIEGQDAVCVFVNDPVPPFVIDKLKEKGIKVILLRCAGYDNVDIPYARSKGIEVCHVPAYSPYAPSEHAVALILSLNRKIHKAYNRTREGDFRIAGLMGFDIFGKTVGVLGTGKIGANTCRIMLGFGAKVLAFDAYENNDLKKLGVQYLSKEEVLKQSDVISIHLPLLPSTKHFINAESIALMKPGVLLVNTSRGALVNTKDVIDGLKSGKIGALGIDVYEQERGLFFEDKTDEVITDDVLSRLMSFHNVIVTAHMGFFTKEAIIAIANTVLDNASSFAAGKPQNAVKL